MKMIDKIISYISSYKQPVTIMEVCGSHTQSIANNGIRDLLPKNIRLVSGPGCPVCVTPASYIEYLVELSFKFNTVILTFGDMLRVKGYTDTLDSARAKGGNIFMIYSPFDVLDLARENPNTEYIISAVGFETTVPVYAALLEQLELHKIKNVKLLTSLRATLPALNYICLNSLIDGFLCPGHVAAITGSKDFEKIAYTYKKPFVISGFEGEHILISLYIILKQITEGKFSSFNAYPSVVSEDGNIKAKSLIKKYFSENLSHSVWRGIGVIKNSGYTLNSNYSEYTVENSYCVSDMEQSEAGCLCGDILLGKLLPPDCPLFGINCTPDNPVGACMVSSEGVCGIWYSSSDLYL